MHKMSANLNPVKLQLGNSGLHRVTLNSECDVSNTDEHVCLEAVLKITVFFSCHHTKMNQKRVRKLVADSAAFIKNSPMHVSFISVLVFYK